VCGFLLQALLKLLSSSHAQVSFFFSLPYFLLLAPLAAAHDNGQESRKTHYLSMRNKKHCWYEENSTLHRAGVFLTLRFTKTSFSLDLSPLPLPPDQLPNIATELKETVLLSSQEVSCICKCNSFYSSSDEKKRLFLKAARTKLSWKRTDVLLCQIYIPH